MSPNKRQNFGNLGFVGSRAIAIADAGLKCFPLDLTQTLTLTGTNLAAAAYVSMGGRSHVKPRKAHLANTNLCKTDVTSCQSVSSQSAKSLLSCAAACRHSPPQPRPPWLPQPASSAHDAECTTASILHRTASRGRVLVNLRVAPSPNSIYVRGMVERVASMKL